MRGLDKAAEFQTSISYVDGRPMVMVRGELDLYTAPVMRERLTGLASDGHRRIVIDCGGLEFIDSTGLGVLVDTLKRARTNGGDVVLSAVPKNAMRVLEITGLTRVFTIEDNPGGESQPS